MDVKHTNGTNFNSAAVLNFGHYSNNTYQDVYDKDHAYALSILNSGCRTDDSNNPMFKFKEWVFYMECQRRKDEILKMNKYEKASKKLGFGWHCHHSYASVYICDYEYCVWILFQEIDSSNKLYEFYQWLCVANEIKSTVIKKTLPIRKKRTFTNLKQPTLDYFLNKK